MKLLWPVVVQDTAWLAAVLLLLGMTGRGWFGWKHRERIEGWLKGLVCYIVVELFLHERLEWLAGLMYAKLISRWES